MDKLINDITNWLQHQVKQAHVKGLLVGLSGGLDSAVVAFLIKKAFPHDSLGVVMPIHSNPNDLVDAQKVIEQAGLESMTVDLTETHQLLYGNIQQQLEDKQSFHQEKDRIANANLRARLRMGTLYTIATQLNYLVVGTDNKAEWYTGYFTKYGDGGVDIQPIIALTKTEVREMARHLGVPNTVIEKKPSADLWLGQTDEAEMGTTYHYIDAFLQGEDIPAKDKAVIEKMHERTAHKRKIATQFLDHGSTNNL